MNTALVDTLKALAIYGGGFSIGVITYDEAKDIWDKKKKDVKIGNNTWLVKTSNGDYGIKYHNTVIMKYLPHDLYLLDNGGYDTSTTKERYNALSPINIYQEKNQWYVTPSGINWQDAKKNRVPFRRGMIVNTDGDIVG